MKRANNQEQIDERKNEIINVVSNMFDTMDYQSISMKTISEHISIARSSLYTYYSSKEEIMLDVLNKDYLDFLNELSNSFNSNLNIESLSKSITLIYLNHKKLLKIISIYLVDIESHVSLDKLINFKKSFINPLNALKESMNKCFKSNKKEDIDFIYNTLIMLTHSLYPLINPNDNQKEAMIKVGMNIVTDEYNFTYKYIYKILTI